MAHIEQVESNTSEPKVSENLTSLSHKNNDGVSITKLLNTPENFKAGKVKLFIHKWEKITTDKTILDALNGYQLMFDTRCQQGINVTIHHLLLKKYNLLIYKLKNFCQKK